MKRPPTGRDTGTAARPRRPAGLVIVMAVSLPLATAAAAAAAAAATTTTTTMNLMLLATAAASCHLVEASGRKGWTVGAGPRDSAGPSWTRRHPGESCGTGLFVKRRPQALAVPRGGGGGGAGSVASSKAQRSSSAPVPTKSKSAGLLLLPPWFRPGRPLKERQLSAALLVWNALAVVDAVRFTLFPLDNLRGYFTESHQALHPQVVVMTRFLANCQWAYLGTSAMVALTAPSEIALRAAFGVAILATLGAFRAVGLGIADGVLKAPWKSKYASLLTLPPLLLLSYFAFWF